MSGMVPSQRHLVTPPGCRITSERPNSLYRTVFVDGIRSPSRSLTINMIAAIPVAFWSTFGPVVRMHQTVLSGFYFGFHGIKIGEMTLLSVNQQFVDNNRSLSF